MSDLERPTEVGIDQTRPASDVAAEIMSAESICAMGNGACVIECPLFEAGKAIFSETPPDADLTQLRSALRTGAIFGDIFRDDVSLADTKRIISSCVLENPPGPAS